MQAIACPDERVAPCGPRAPGTETAAVFHGTPCYPRLARKERMLLTQSCTATR